MSEQDNSQDSEVYQAKKKFFANMLTIYGRKPVLEALEQKDISPFRLHLAERNRDNGIIKEIIKLAEKKSVEIKYHPRKDLAHISKNGKQDQGVVLDIALPGYQAAETLSPTPGHDYIALENVTNPQNLGMIIRSVGASPCQGLILPKNGNAKIDALVIKASAGTAFKAPIFYCDDAIDGLRNLKHKGFNLVGLSSYGSSQLQQIDNNAANIFIMGNETHGLTDTMLKMCSESVSIPLNHGVESLNVAMAASLMAFRRVFQ